MQMSHATLQFDDLGFDVRRPQFICELDAERDNNLLHQVVPSNTTDRPRTA